MSSARLTWAGLVLALCLLGGALRARGLDFLLPHQTALDGTVIVHQMDALREPDAALAQKKRAARFFRFYPLLLARAIVLLPDPLPPGATGETPEQREHLARASAYWLQARRVSLWLSLLMVPATFLLARRFLARPWALCAAALVTTSLLHMRFGTMVRPHGVASALIAWALVAALHLRRHGGAPAFALAAVAGALALGGLHYGVFALPAILVGALARPGGAWRGGRWRGTTAGIALGLAAAYAALRVFYPYWFTGELHGMLQVEETAGDGAALNLSGQPLKLERFDGSGFAVLLCSLWSYDPLLLAALAAGVACAAAAWRRSTAARADALVLAAFALPYLLVVGLYAETWERFLLPLLPCIATIAALALARLHARARGLGLACTALVLGGATALCVQLGNVRSADDSHERVAEWVARNLGQDSLLLTTFRDVPVYHARRALRRNRRQSWGSQWVRYQLAHEDAQRGAPRFDVFLPVYTSSELAAGLAQDPRAFLDGLGMDRVLLEDVPAWAARDRPGGGEAAQRLLRDLRAAVRVGREPLWRVSPDRDGAQPSLAYQASQMASAGRPYFWALLRARHLGPALEIYALDD